MSSRFARPSFCKVLDCRYSSTHTTKGHRCGMCGSYGHGEIECLQPWRKIHLEEYYADVLPNNMLCTVPDCNWKQYHTAAAHHCPYCTCRCTHTQEECPLAERIIASRRTATEPTSTINTKYVKCPICREESQMRNPSKIYGLTDICCICLDKNVEIVLTECNHCCICKDCYDKIM